MTTRGVVAARLVLKSPRATAARQQIQYFANNARLSTNSSRPILPFLSVPSSLQTRVRHYTSERGRWWKHEAKLVVRYTVIFWGIILSCLTIAFFVSEELLERDFPTPHEWTFITRKLLRDANKFKAPRDGHMIWAQAFQLSRITVDRLEDPKKDGLGVKKLPGPTDVPASRPGEFEPCDISEKPEEWRRGYFEAMMLVAKAAEHVDGWVMDKARNLASAPEFVIGPSNPRPTPIAPGNPPAPREEDCEQAWPTADNYYMKILATQGFNSRQKVEAALEYASYIEYKQVAEGPEALYNLALAEATKGLDMSRLPYDAKTFVVKDGTGPASMNVLDVLTTIATHKARRGDLSAALPIYISLLKARRSLSNDPPPAARTRARRRSLFQRTMDIFAPPDYPPPPPDGSQPPWRSVDERCQEAALTVYIGEILYATSSRDEGLAWTREGVDVAEEQLRKLGQDTTEKATRTTCRECLVTGLDNWAAMVSKLAREEAARKEQGPQSKVFGFWSGSQDATDRWAAEELVVKERIRRTRELIEDVELPASGIMSWFQA